MRSWPPMMRPGTPRCAARSKGTARAFPRWRVAPFPPARWPGRERRCGASRRPPALREGAVIGAEEQRFVLRHAREGKPAVGVGAIAPYPKGFEAEAAAAVALDPAALQVPLRHGGGIANGQAHRRAPGRRCARIAAPGAERPCVHNLLEALRTPGAGRGTSDRCAPGPRSCGRNLP